VFKGYNAGVAARIPPDIKRAQSPASLGTNNELKILQLAFTDPQTKRKIFSETW